MERAVALILALNFMTAGCNFFTPRREISPTIWTPEVTLLGMKREVYVVMSALQARPHGFVRGCDGITFTGLGAYGGMLADMPKAMAAPGEWKRRPIPLGNCYPEESQSELSGEGAMTIALWAYKNKDLKALEDLYDYAKKNHMTLGRGASGDTKLSPQLAGTILQMIYLLGGRNEPGRFMPMAYSTGLSGYERHVHLVHIYIRFLVYGIDEAGLETVKHYAEESPNNAFFQALYHLHDGDQRVATKLLMATEHWPISVLPSSNEHCEPYLWQRNEDSDDWKPCPAEKQQHSGADFIFVSEIILQGRG